MLRVLSCVAVIAIHVSATYIGAYHGEDGKFFYQDHFWITNLYNVLSRFAVPCFVMLSGAFLLPQQRNADYRAFYRKSLRGVGVQTAVFSAFYFLYAFCVAIAAVVIKKRGLTRLLSPVKSLVKGEPFYHMWYLYMLIGVYLLIPFVARFRQSVSERMYSRVVWLFLIAATFSMWTADYTFHWDIGRAFCYLGYLMAGDRIRVLVQERKSNAKGICLITAGFAVELGMAYLQYCHMQAGINEKYTLVGPSNPMITVASLLIFAGFSLLTVRVNWEKTAQYAFYIYLFHAGVWDILKQILQRTGAQWDSRIVIPAGIGVVFALSYAFSAVYLNIWRTADKKLHLTDRLCRLVRLDA